MQTSVRSLRAPFVALLWFAFLLPACSGGDGAVPPDLGGDAGADTASAADATGGGDVVARDAAATDATETDGAGPDTTAADTGASDATDGDAGGTSPDVDEGLEEVPLAPSEAALARKAEYVQACFDASAPGSGRLDGQTCRVALGDQTTGLDEAIIDDARNRMELRQDTADFRAATLVRLLYLDDTNPVLSEATRAGIEDTLLGFRYWLDQPGDDQMCFWSENHQILFHSAELLVGQRFPDTVLPNSGWTGAEHVAHATPRIERWLDLRGRFGFSEWHSNVYFNEDIPALVNLADFAEDEGIRTRAAMVLDLLAFDLLNNTYRGLFATTHGRTYPNKLVGGLNDSTREATWMMTGLGERGSPTNFSGAFLATSPRYVPPSLLEDVAAAAANAHEHRQRDSWDVAEGPAVGVTYDDLDDVVVWAGMSALAAAEVVDGTMTLLDTYDLWDGFLFGALPPELRTLLQGLSGTPALASLARQIEVVSRGIALQAVDTYTWRTPHYQLSGAQDYHPGYWSAQTHQWQATLDRDAFVFTAVPTDILVDIGDDVSIGGGWTGSFLPRVTLHRNVGVVQYRLEDLPTLVAEYLAPGFVHAYVPRTAFDELREEGSWIVARKGEGFLALWSQAPTHWADDNDYELRTDVTDNVWIVELGSVEDWASFDEFAAAVQAASVAVSEDGDVTYDSPSQGVVTVGWTAPMTVAGAPVDLGPYPRWDNAFSRTERGARRTRIQWDETILELDFERGTRRLLTPRVK